MLRVLLIAGLIGFAGPLSSCGEPVGPGNDHEMASVFVSAPLSSTAIASITVKVSAQDIADTLVFNIPRDGDQAVGTVTVPVGSDRHFLVSAFDAAGVETHRGSETVTVREGTNPTVSITLEPLTGDQPITAVISSIIVTVEPSSVSVDVGQSATLSGVVTTTAGDTLNDARVHWASLDPGIAAIDTLGRVTGMAQGTTAVVGVYSNVAGLADVNVTETDTSSLAAVEIPTDADFTDHGPILTPDAGEWDARFTYGAPSTIVKVGSTYYMYYIGSDGARSDDDGPSHRTVGLATAPASNPTTWTKHASNPVIAWNDVKTSSPDDDEEGIWRAAVMRDTDDTFLLYGGKQFKSTSLSGYQIDMYLWTSSDGLSWTEDGFLFAAPSGATANSEDEVAALGAATDGTDYYLQYVQQTTNHDWGWGISTAQTRDGFSYNDDALLDHPDGISRGSNPIRISETEWISIAGTIAGDILIYRTSSPDALGTLEETWTGMMEGNVAVYLDRDTDTWIVVTATGQSDYQGLTGSQADDNFAELRLFTAPVVYK